MYRVLLVDDWDIFLTETKRLKVWGEESGFEAAASAANGKEALELLHREKFDLVLTDIRMPVMDGLQLLRRIKREKCCPCVVLLSEYCEFRYARQGIVLGAFDYLVKPPEESALLELFGRARSFLDSLSRENESMPAAEIAAGWEYPQEEEKHISDALQRRRPDALSLFCSTVDHLYGMMEDNVIRADLMARRLYHNVVDAAYLRFPWLANYIDSLFFDLVDFSHEGENDAYRGFYCKRIDFLLHFIKKFLPESENDTIGEICSYVLSHPEADLKLKVLAQKFYMNPTYLSSTFPVKTGMHFNDYVTQVKMARAEYLLRNTGLKIYDVSYRLGYHDIDYFSRRFKKYYGRSPVAYRSMKDAQENKNEAMG